MRIWASTLALPLLAGAIVSASAQPPPSMWEGSFQKPMLVCDTAQEIKEIVAARLASSESFVRVLEKSCTGEKPPCKIDFVRAVVVGESEDLGPVSRDGARFHLWIVHFGTMAREAYALYEEGSDRGGV